MPFRWLTPLWDSHLFPFGSALSLALKEGGAGWAGWAGGVGGTGAAGAGGSALGAAVDMEACGTVLCRNVGCCCMCRWLGTGTTLGCIGTLCAGGTMWGGGQGWVDWKWGAPGTMIGMGDAMDGVKCPKPAGGPTWPGLKLGDVGKRCS